MGTTFHLTRIACHGIYQVCAQVAHNRANLSEVIAEQDQSPPRQYAQRTAVTARRKRRDGRVEIGCEVCMNSVHYTSLTA